MGLVSSGCLIAVVAANDAESVVAGLESEGIVAAVAGYATANRDVVLRTESGAVGLPEFDRDELARYLDENASG
jgi:hydrogenase maturation factor